MDEGSSNPTGAWVMSKDSPLSAALVGNWKALSPLRARIRDTATTLSLAMESPDATISTLFSVAALETLLGYDGSSDFKEIEELASCIFADANGPSAISTLISNRHKVAHQAKAAHSAAEHAGELATAWAIILHASMLASDLSSTEDFLGHLRGRVLARRVGRELREPRQSGYSQKRWSGSATFPSQRRRGVSSLTMVVPPNSPMQLASVLGRPGGLPHTFAADWHVRQKEKRRNDRSTYREAIGR